MKGYIPVEIPTKKYIKRYLISELGEKPIMSNDNRFGSKLYDLLEHNTNEERKRFSNVRYTETLRIYITQHSFRVRGANLNHTNIKNFNLFVENELKSRFRMYMDFYMNIFPNFKANLQTVREHLGIDFEHWDDESIQKDYYRYRLRTGKPLLYKNVMPSQHIDFAF